MSRDFRTIMSNFVATDVYVLFNIYVNKSATWLCKTQCVKKHPIWQRMASLKADIATRTREHSRMYEEVTPSERGCFVLPAVADGLRKLCELRWNALSCPDWKNLLLERGTVQVQVAWVYTVGVILRDCLDTVAFSRVEKQRVGCIIASSLEELLNEVMYREPICL